VLDYETHIKPPYILYGKAGCCELLYALGGGGIVHTTGSSFADSGRAPSYITLLPIVLAFQVGLYPYFVCFCTRPSASRTE
jgi:hypothetical protein